MIESHYQSTLDASRAAVQETRSTPRLPGFWRLSTGFFSAEGMRDYIAELALFAVIGTISAWSVVVAFHAAVRLVRNY